MPINRLMPITGVLLLAVAPITRADLFEPFLTRNMSPFVLVHGIPATRSARLPEENTWDWQIQTDLANNFTQNSKGDESILLDGETHQVTLAARYGFSDRFELGIEVPYLRHSGGFLDNFIERWHKLFGFSNHGREDVPQDELNYGHQLNGVSSFLLDDSTSGIGDVRLSAGYALKQTDLSLWTVRAGVKLATGDAEDLTGSEGTDVYASVHYTRNQAFGSENWQVHGNLGFVALGDGEVIPGQQEDWATFGSTTLGWQPEGRRISLKLQADFHSALYDSNVREIGDFSLQLVAGGSIKVSETGFIDISVAEDILHDRSPDVVFQFGYRATF